jgi:tRNA A-37 threonylcarbamoyl transferase component Bud32
MRADLEFVLARQYGTNASPERWSHPRRNVAPLGGNRTMTRKPLDPDDDLQSGANEPTLDDAVDTPEIAGRIDPPSFPGYTILEALGMGGFGVVYRARDDKLQREVALKVHLRPSEIDPALQTRFLKEARTLAKVRHPNVLAIHAVLEHEGLVGLVTEFIDGQPLSDILEENGPFSASETVQMGTELCRALAAVHAAGIVHRDVKTSNILRERGGRIVLADFGLGVFLHENKAVDQGNLIAGSPLFMAPEQILGDPVDERTDLYGLAIVLYHLSTGRFPVDSYDMRTLFSRIASGDLIPIRDARPDLPTGFTQMMQRAMHPDPPERFQSAGELEQALLSGLGSDVAPAPPVVRERPVKRQPTRMKSIAGGGALAVAAIALAVVILAIVLTRPGGFQVKEAALYRVDGKSNERLRSGDKVTVGDRLFLNFRADEDVHVYVLNEDLAGNRYLLFPLRSGGLQNPLPADQVHRLPGSLGGQAKDWTVNSTGETEHFYIIASAKRQRELEETLGKQDLALAYPELGAREVAALVRGIGGLAKADQKAVARNHRRLETVIDTLRAAAVENGVWIEHLALENP